MEQIDLNQIKLEDEIIFSKKPSGKLTITALNKKGIFTIENFINSDINQITSDSNRKKQFRAFQKILRYKYLGEPLTIDVILDREYKNEQEINLSLHDDMIGLGFGNYFWGNFPTEILAKKGSCKMRDVILYIHGRDEHFSFLTNFYVEYYNTQMKKDEKEEHIIENDKESLSTLKDELVTLLNQRNALDLKISTILEKINTLKGEKDLNARK